MHSRRHQMMFMFDASFFEGRHAHDRQSGRRPSGRGAPPHRHRGAYRTAAGGTPRPDRPRSLAPARATRRERAGCETYSSATQREEMILVDTSVWIEHLRVRHERLATALED